MRTGLWLIIHLLVWLGGCVPNLSPVKKGVLGRELAPGGEPRRTGGRRLRRLLWFCVSVVIIVLCSICPGEYNTRTVRWGRVVRWLQALLIRDNVGRE